MLMRLTSARPKSADSSKPDAYVAGPPTSYGDRKRWEGLKAALEQHGLSLVAETTGTPDLDGGIAAGNALLSKAGRIDAVLCYNDMIAVGLMGVFKAAGICHPGRPRSGRL